MNLPDIFSASLSLISRSAESALSPLTNPSQWLNTSILHDGFYAGQDSGVAVNSKSIQQIPAYISGLRLLSESMGSLSGKLIQETTDRIIGRKDHPAFKLVFRQPNAMQTSPVFWETCMKYCVHKGNFFALILRDGSMKPIELIPIHESNTVKVFQSGNRLWYQVSGIAEMIPDYNMLHFKGLGDGIIGIGAIEYAATSAGITLATQQNQAKFFKSGSKLQGYISHPKMLKETALKNLRSSWHQIYHNSSATNNQTAILDEGMEYKTISVTPEAAKYLETLKNGYYDIAAILRVPPHMIGLMDKSSFNNIEQQSLEYVKYSLMPWIHKFEMELWSKLLTESEKDTDELKFRFNLETLLRGDYKTRMEGYQVGISSGIMSPNEARRLEGQEPFEGGDKKWMPLNYAPIDHFDNLLKKENGKPD